MRSNKMGKLMEFLTFVTFLHVTCFITLGQVSASSFLQFLGLPKLWSCFHSIFHSSFLIFWALFGPNSMQSMHPAAFSSLYMRAFAAHRDSVYAEEERTLPAAALSAPHPLPVHCGGCSPLHEIYDLAAFQSCHDWELETLPAAGLCCGHGHPAMGRASCSGHWGHSSSHSAVSSLVQEQLWHTCPRAAPSSKGKCWREWVSNPQRNLGHESVTLQLLHCQMQYTGDLCITEL